MDWFRYATPFGEWTRLSRRNTYCTVCRDSSGYLAEYGQRKDQRINVYLNGWLPIKFFYNVTTSGLHSKQFPVCSRIAGFLKILTNRNRSKRCQKQYDPCAASITAEKEANLPTHEHPSSLLFRDLSTKCYKIKINILQKPPYKANCYNKRWV